MSASTKGSGCSSVPLALVKNETGVCSNRSELSDELMPHPKTVRPRRPSAPNLRRRQIAHGELRRKDAENSLVEPKFLRGQISRLAYRSTVPHFAESYKCSE